ncbi:major facilitator superfamily domain-containing protein [Geopyxis carbonaria]|nr:major facilitator superfamily domain-containing protein [Geopyxis carbonaria]
MASTHTSITSAFHASELASWLSTSFLLTSTSFQPLYGRVSDVTGRKIPYVFSCVVFTVATIWCALAQSIESFIAARAVCGLGAGGMLTMGSIVLSDMLPIEIRGTYQSINNLFYGMGSALGAALGGFLADVLGWRWEFGIQVPFGIFCIFVCAFTIPDQQEPTLAAGRKEGLGLWDRFRDFDFAGSVYLTTSVAFIILGMNLGGNIFPWTDWRVVSALVLGLFLVNMLLRTEKKAKSPVMPLALLTSSPRGNLVWNGFMGMLTVNSIWFNIPLYFQAVLLESATKAGGRLLIPSLAGTVGAVSTGLIITRTGRLDYTLYAGSGIMLAGTIILAFMQPDFSDLLFFFFLIPCNLGLGLALPSGLMSILATSSQTDQAVTTSTLIMMRSLGNVLGVATSSLILQNCLFYFLEQNITGPGKQEIIKKVRSSVTAVFDLDPAQQAQVVMSYNSSLKFCFLFSIITAFITFALIFGIKLPTLRTKESERLKHHSTAVE